MRDIGALTVRRQPAPGDEGGCVDYLSPIGFQYLSNVSVLSVPEPPAAALLLVGLAAVVTATRRDRAAQSSRR